MHSRRQPENRSAPAVPISVAEEAARSQRTASGRRHLVGASSRESETHGAARLEAVHELQTPITIRDVLDRIHRHDYVLPAIQREFVWRPEQISRLSDSLMQDYRSARSCSGASSATTFVSTSSTTSFGTTRRSSDRTATGRRSAGQPVVAV